MYPDAMMITLEALAATATNAHAASLKPPGRVLLVSCYELGRQPLAIAGPLALLRHAGFQPSVVDTALDPLPDPVIARARLIAIAAPMHTALRLGVAIAERVRSVNPRAHVCFYGLYATLNAGHLLAAHADSVISGEVDGPLLALANTLEAGKPAGEATGVRFTAATAAPALEPLPPGLRDLPPSRGGLPEPRRYAGLEHHRVIVPVGAVEATRGCHHLCRHCPVPPVYGGKFVVVPRPVVVADALAQIETGARHITFADPDFFNGPAHGLRIMREIRQQAPGVTFDATIKVEHLLQHRNRLAELAELGCVFVVSAVESLNDTVLERLVKGHTGSDVDEALGLLDEAGVAMRPSLLPFTPWETLESYRALLTWIARRDMIDQVDPIMLAIRLLVPPGSMLLTEDDTQRWLGPLDAPNFTYKWVHPDPRMDALHAEITRIAGEAARLNAEARDTFPLIWEAAWRIDGTTATVPVIPARELERPSSPRLTESWFCCAEPSPELMAPLLKPKSAATGAHPG